jgi:hypothetical protein
MAAKAVRRYIPRLKDIGFACWTVIVSITIQNAQLVGLEIRTCYQ